MLVFGALTLFLLGGTVTIFGIKFDLPGLANLDLKRFIVSQEEVVERFWEYESDHPVIQWEATIEGGSLIECRITKCSSKANELCGFTSHGEALDRRDRVGFCEALKGMMIESDFQRFRNDQERMFSELANSHEAIARVPIVFSNSHSYQQFRNKQYLPIFVGAINRDYSGPDDRTYRVLVTMLLLDLEQADLAAPSPITNWWYKWSDKTFNIRIMPKRLVYFNNYDFVLLAQEVPSVKEDRKARHEYMRTNTAFDISEPMSIAVEKEDEHEMKVACKRIGADIAIGDDVYVSLIAIPKTVRPSEAESMQDLLGMGGILVSTVGKSAIPDATNVVELLEYYRGLTEEQREQFEEKRARLAF